LQQVPCHLRQSVVFEQDFVLRAPTPAGPRLNDDTACITASLEFNKQNKALSLKAGRIVASLRFET
jgi:hypothetical protein